MLNKLKLTNFKRHEDLCVDLSQGLNVVRGSNEAGKSSMLLGVAYALYGSGVLPTPLSETVTWGKDEKTLKAEVTLDVQGQDYTFVRSKSGAEVITEGKVFVTGQKDVSAFATQLIGADANTASLLMLASQGSLRGTLSDGPKATAQVIEALADLDLFDRLLNAATEQLPTGSPKMIETKLEGLRAQQSMLEMPDEPDRAAHEAYVAKVKSDLTSNAKLQGEYQTLVDDVQKKWQAQIDLQEKRDRLLDQSDHLIQTVRDNEARIEQEKAKVFPSDLDKRIEAELQAVEFERTFEARRQAWEKFQKIPQHKAPLQQSVTSVKAEVKDLEGNAEALRSENITLRGDIRALKERLVTSSTCGFCGQDVSQFPEVAKKNAQVEAEIKDKELAIEANKKVEDMASTKLQSLQSLLDEQPKIDRLIRGIEQYLEVDENTTPNRVTWKGQVPDTEADRYDPEPELKRLQSWVKERDQSATRIETYKESIHETRLKLQRIEAQINELELMPEDEFQRLERLLGESSGTLSSLTVEAEDLKKDLEERERQFNEQLQNWDRARETAERLAREIRESEEMIEQMAFNTELVKKIRAARPAVANKLWGLVLTSVSTLFSQMRGEKSVVEKAKTGFTVNGKAVESLSGSTLDILGLAVRVALTKTFLPGCPFLVLDEPAQGCDGDRTESLIGFVASCGFQQVLMVTHDPISESFADNLIEL